MLKMLKQMYLDGRHSRVDIQREHIFLQGLFLVYWPRLYDLGNFKKSSCTTVNGKL